MMFNVSDFGILGKTTIGKAPSPIIPPWAKAQPALLQARVLCVRGGIAELEIGPAPCIGLQEIQVYWHHMPCLSEA